MIACPLCEHVQPEGDACDVCGRALERPGDVAVAIPALDGLEPTAQPGPDPLDVPPLAELEPTALDAGASSAPAVEPFPELEPTRAPAVEVAAEPVPDLEPTAPAPADAPTPLADSAICRYCRTPAATACATPKGCAPNMPCVRAAR